MAKEIVFDSKQNLNSIDIHSGEFKVCYNIFKNIVGSHLGNRLYISEISTSRLEIKVKRIDEQTDWNILSTIEDKLDNYIINFGENYYELIVNWVIDNDSVVFKLAKELSDEYDIKDQLWISQIIALPVEGTVTLDEADEEVERSYIKGPNFNIELENVSIGTTDYKNWDDLLSTNTSTVNNILENVVSSSYGNSVDLSNVDYSDYNEFIHFGSATERLKNFKYKLQLIELYDTQISDSYNASTGSYDGVTQSLSTYNKLVQRRQGVINTFDSYEKYMYYESSSAAAASDNLGWGVQYETTWPKSGSWKNYTLYSVTSSEATTWYGEQLVRAEEYDLENPHGLINTLPKHIVYGDYNTSASVSFDASTRDVSSNKTYTGDNDEYLTFVHMVGQYFDQYWSYIKNIKQINKRSSDKNDSVSERLIEEVLNSLGLKFESDHLLDELWDYYNGTDSSGNILQSGSFNNPIYSIDKKDYVFEVNNRLLNNLSYLYKTRGTKRSIRAILNCFGIPNTILRIKEYGGPTAEKFKAGFYDYEYALNVGNSDNSNYVSFYSKNHDDFSNDGKTLELSFIPKWSQDTVVDNKYILLTSNNLATDAPFVYITRLDESSEYGYMTFERSDNSAINWTSSNLKFFENEYSGSYGPDYVDNFWTFGMTSDLSESASFYLKKAKYGKIFESWTGSDAGDDSTVQSVQYFFDTMTASVGGEYLNIGSGSRTGYLPLDVGIRSIRVWSEELTNNEIEEHTLWRDSIYYNSGSSVLTDLMYDWSFNSSSISSSINNIAPGDTSDLTATVNYTSLPTSTDSFSKYNTIHAPNDTSKWVSDNKVRVESSSFINSDQSLSYNSKMVQHAYDLAPLDLNKVGIFFSPADVINNDIIGTYASWSLDNYVGNPSDLYENEYSELNTLNENYWERYPSAYDMNEYLRYIKIVDSALFKVIKKFLPARSKANLGIVIEPHIFDRSKTKILRDRPEYSNLTYTSSIDYNDLALKETVGSYLVHNTIINQYNNEIVESEISNLVGNISSIIDSDSSGSLFNMINSVVNVKNRYIGTLQDSSTTLDKTEPVEIYITDSNKLTVQDTDDGDVRLKVT